MNLGIPPFAPAPTTAPATSPVLATFVDTEVYGMYDAEVRLGSSVPRTPPSTSLADAIAAAQRFTAGDDAAGMAVIDAGSGTFALRPVELRWRDLDSGAYTTEFEPAHFDGTDSYIERTADGAALLAIVDGDTVLEARDSSAC